MPLYLGNPVGTLGIRTMPYLPRGYSAPISRDETVHGLISGGTSTTRRPRSRRSFSYQWQPHDFTPETADELVALYTGVHGPGPYVLLPPEQRNFAPQQVGSFGAVGGGPGWVASVGTYTPNLAGIALPTGVLSGVGRWTGAGSGSLLTGGGALSTIDPLLNSVFCPNVAAYGYVWAKTASSTATLTLSLYGGTSGAGTSQAASSGIVVGTTWTQITALFAATASPVPYVYPRISCSTASAPTIYLAGYQFGYSTAATDPYVQPLGTPRVVVASGLGMDVDVLPYRAHSLALAEV
jgi:hypothetical protein